MRTCCSTLPPNHKDPAYCKVADHILRHTCHGAGAAMGPAGATVLGNVLVAGRAHIVDAIDVPPVPRFGQIRNV